MKLFADLHKNAQNVEDQLEDYEIDAARTSLDTAQDQVSDYAEIVNDIHESSDNLAALLGDAWEPVVSATANLSARITDTLGRIDNGSADVPGLLSAADQAEDALDTAREFSKGFAQRLAQFKDVTITDIRKVFDGSLRPALEAMRAALARRNSTEAQAKISDALKALDQMISQASAATTATTPLGSTVGELWEPVPPALSELQKAVVALQAVVGRSNPDSALSAVNTAEATADKALNEAFSRMTDAQGRFVLICDSICR
ncbi:MAG: hypothetical protein QM698_02115 [Micropepsaceae bacterium]